MNRFACFAVLTAAAFALKVGPATERFRLCPDAVAYLDIAKNLASGDGFVSTLKLNFLDGSGVTHCALFDWPPLYPLFAGVLVILGAGETGLQVVNAVMASVTAGLVFLIGERMFGRRAGLLAGAFAAIAPNLFRSGITALADPLGLVLALAAVLLALGAEGHPPRWAVVGALIGAAHLAKYPHAIFLGAAMWALLSTGRRSCAAACALGFVSAAAPAGAWRWVLYGSPFACAQAYHYAVESYSMILWDSTVPAFPTVFAAPIGDIALSVGAHAIDLLMGLRGLFALSIGLVAAIVWRRHPGWSWQHRFVLAAAVGSFAVHAFTWSIPPLSGSRFLLPAFCLLLPFAAAGILRLFDERGAVSRTVAAAACACTFGAYCWGLVTAARYTGGEVSAPDSSIIRWISISTAPGQAVATNNPWAVNYWAGRPAVCLPRGLDAPRTDEFAARHDVTAIVVFSVASARADLTNLREEGFETSHLGSAVVARRVSEGTLAKQADYGQKAYEGSLSAIPQIVQKLPTMHSPRITPRKNGSACL